MYNLRPHYCRHGDGYQATITEKIKSKRPHYFYKKFMIDRICV
ncbi:hypothetical protein AOT82_193 [Psychrobacter sp. AntiMn-1]|nr:hypothetical protein AOT82_193 [Psychrobacter sp. AntiMn-1]